MEPEEWVAHHAKVVEDNVVEISPTLLFEYYLVKAQEYIFATLLPSFDKQLKEVDEEDADGIFDIFSENLAAIDSVDAFLLTLLEKTDSEASIANFSKHQTQTVPTALALSLPHFPSAAAGFISEMFDEAGGQFDDDEESINELLGDEDFPLKQFARLADGKLDNLLEVALMQVIEQKLKTSVTDQCSGGFDEYLLRDVLAPWVESFVLKFIRIVLYKEEVGSPVLLERQRQIMVILDRAFSETINSLIFDVVVQYPASVPVLKDLKKCLHRSGMYPEFVKSLTAALKSRLLVPGATTEVILQLFIGCIKCLKIIDPSGVVMEAISPAISDYLRNRADTIRCIVTKMTNADGEQNELFDELRSTATPDKSDTHWTPDPLHLIPGQSVQIRTSAKDILSMFVGIYGSKEIFAKEYATILGERLLSSVVVETQQEISNVELLKIKFGEEALLRCEVMLKDMADSKRMQAYRKTLLEKNEDVSEAQKFPLSATIVSGLFWPPIESEDFELPPSVQAAMDKYNANFKALKTRSLRWKKSVGVVNVTLNLNSHSMEFNVSPIQATLIYLFQEKAQWTLAEIGEKLKVTEELVRSKMTFWLTQKLVLFDSESQTYELRADFNGLEEGEQIQEEVEEDMISPQAQAESELLETISSFMQGMLRMHSHLEVSDIHSRFSLVLDGYSDTIRSEGDLTRLLEPLLKDGTLELSSQGYSLPSSA